MVSKQARTDAGVHILVACTECARPGSSDDKLFVPRLKFGVRFNDSKNSSPQLQWSDEIDLFLTIPPPSYN